MAVSDVVVAPGPLVAFLAVGSCLVGAATVIGAARRWSRVERALRLSQPLPGFAMRMPLAVVIIVVAAAGLFAMVGR